MVQGYGFGVLGFRSLRVQVLVIGFYDLWFKVYRSTCRGAHNNMATASAVVRQLVVRF
jgi:hypothetical protein